MTNEQLCSEIQQGRKDLLRDIFEMNKGIVFQLARRYSNGDREDEEDLKQELAIALFQCAQRFDPNRGAHFLSAALPWLKRACFDFIYSRPLIHIPRDRLPTLKLYRQLKDDGLRDLEIMQELRLNPFQFAELQRTAAAAERPASLAAPIIGEDGSQTELSDLIADPEDAFVAVEDALEQATLRRMISELPEPHKTVLLLRYDGGLTQNQVAERMNITLRDARRLLQQAHVKLEKQIRKNETIEAESYHSSRVRRFWAGDRTSVVESLALSALTDNTVD